MEPSRNVYFLPFERKHFTAPAPAPFHYKFGDPFAIDFPLEEGLPIFAACDGVVLQVKDGFGKGGNGKEFHKSANLVVIGHAHMERSYYGHLAKGILVLPGQRVRAGELIAYSGLSGWITYSHLHFAVYRGEIPDSMTVPVRFEIDGKIEILISPNGESPRGEF